MVVLSSKEAEYVARTLRAKEATWMRLLLIEIGLLDKDGQYTIINVMRSTRSEQIKANAVKQEGGVVNTLFSIAPNTALTAPTPISLKGENQESIALAHNPIFHARTKHIDI